jgi:acetyltransferase-like isoleucine patch superfamily enzyme
MKLKYLRLKCEEAESNLIITLWKRFIYVKKWGKNILVHHKVEIKNVKNINTNGLLKVGIENIGFTSKYDRTFLNVRGKLNFLGQYSIGKGSRFDIGQDAIVVIGSGGYMSANVTVIISHKLIIGSDCAISWGCQFLDEDFHTMEYPERKLISDKSIIIGDHVWIGSNTSIYKGVSIASGIVIASDSVVKNSFIEENVLIGGNPAIILKRNINWKN